MIATHDELGQINLLTRGVSNDLATAVLAKADPIVRDVVDKNRTLIADSIISGLPFFVIGAAGAIGTWFLMDTKSMKVLGYSVSAGMGAFGIYNILSKLMAEKPPVPPSAPSSIPGVAQGTIDATVTALVSGADPRIRAIIDQERARLASAAQAGIPWIMGGAVGVVSTMIFMPDNDLLKAIGYIASIGIMAAGAWTSLEVMK